MNYTTEQIYTIAKAVREMNPDEVAVMEYMMEQGCDRWVDITHSQLARAVDRYVSNVRKGVLKLEKKGIVVIDGKPMKSLFLHWNWPALLLERSDYSGKVSL